MAPFHQIGENPTLALERDMELIEWLDRLGFDEAWIGEHHSAGWETISSPEIFIGAAAQRTKHIKLGTGVISLPYHHPLMAANRMLQLDHMTRGRVMMGVGPGALVGDAFMMGIDPPTQRRRMDEALGIILRPWTEKEPITYESEWFTLREARAHLRPYSQPHMPVAVAASQSLAGMISARKYGVGVLSLNTVRLPGAVAPDLAEFWQIAEETAAENNKTVNRNDWGLALHVHLAGSRKEAIEQARVAAGRYQRLYYEDILGLPQASDVSEDKIIDYMVETNNWCVGTPDDLVEHILRLDEESGGFGRALVQATEWVTREQALHSYELIARYVMPRFQGSLTSLEDSAAWTIEKRPELVSLAAKGVGKVSPHYLCLLFEPAGADSEDEPAVGEVV